ncbi:hypothetical protein LCGC14_0828140 [marine sediment metagenome]|uniref:Uncharacterized protein n=1 Tax=marine sediment metagenome TaxID=412755 RepID=A0A0F9PLH2_9ZZZZ
MFVNFNDVNMSLPCVCIHYVYTEKGIRLNQCKGLIYQTNLVYIVGV